MLLIFILLHLPSPFIYNSSNLVDLIFIAVQLNPPLSVTEAFSFLVGSNYKHTVLFCKECSVAQHTGCSSLEHQQSTLQ